VRPQQLVPAGAAQRAQRGHGARTARARSRQHRVGQRSYSGARSACSAVEALAVARQRPPRRRAPPGRLASTSSSTTVWRPSASRTRGEAIAPPPSEITGAGGALEQLAHDLLLDSRNARLAVAAK
jgi:hypothetical protein